MGLWTCEAIDLITEIVPAANLVADLAAETQAALTRAARAIM